MSQSAPKPLFDLLFGSLVLGIFVLDRERPLVADLAERTDKRLPINPAAAGHPVTPPSGMPGVIPQLLAKNPVAISAFRKHLRIFCVRMKDAPGVVACRAVMIDPEPVEMRRIEVQTEVLRWD